MLQIRRGTKRSAKPATPVLLLLQPAHHVCRHVPSGAGKLCDVMFRALLVGFHDVRRQIPDAAVRSMTHDGKSPSDVSKWQPVGQLRHFGN